MDGNLACLIRGRVTNENSESMIQTDPFFESMDRHAMHCLVEVLVNPIIGVPASSV